MVRLTAAALVMMGIALGGGGITMVLGLNQLSFRYDDGLCREITPQNAAQCCLDDPLPPVGPFPGKLVIGIGPRKTGTTYLYSLLQDHPDIRVPNRGLKELHFFSTRRSRLDYNPKEGTLENYMEYWDTTGATDSTVFLEVSSDYFRDPAAPCRLKRMVPDAKILVNLRDPAARALSLTQMLRTHCIKDKDVMAFQLNRLHPEICCTVAKPLHCIFEEAKEELNQTPGCDFQSGVGTKNWKDCAHKDYVHDPIHTGHYAPIIAWWFEFFPPENFLLMRLEEDLMADPLKQANRVLEFMGINNPLKKLPESKTNTGNYSWDEPFLKPTIHEMQFYYSRPNTELTMFLESQGHRLGTMNLESPIEREGGIPLPVECPFKGDFGDFSHNDTHRHITAASFRKTSTMVVRSCNVSDPVCCDTLKDHFYRMTYHYNRKEEPSPPQYTYQLLCAIGIAAILFLWRRPRLAKSLSGVVEKVL